MDALTPQFLFAVMLGVGLCCLAMGLWIGRRRSAVDQYALDFGSMGRKKAKAGRAVYDQDWVCTIYETDFLYLNRYPHRHIMEVPVEMGAVGLSVGILLTAPESLKVEAGDDWPYFERLARDVQSDPFRFKNTPIERQG